MRVFVTGASGWIGSAVIPELIEAGHEVVGLARSDAAAETVEAGGGEVLRGSLEDLDVLRKGAEGSDGVIHLGFVHDFDNYEECNRIDRVAIETMGGALEGSGRPFLIASGVAAMRDEGRTGTERDPADPNFARSAASEMTLALAGRGVRSSVVRLPPTVHGAGDHGFVARLISIAREKGAAGYVGEGLNRWPAVHRSDAAHLYRLALDEAPAGSVLHAVAEEGVTARAMAEAMGRHLDLPVVSVPPDEAMDHFGWLGLFFSADLPTSSGFTKELLKWEPTGPTLIEDLDAGHYFS